MTNQRRAHTALEDRDLDGVRGGASGDAGGLAGDLSTGGLDDYPVAWDASRDGDSYSPGFRSAPDPR
ncbi:MAG: hypothetical protein AAGD13_20520 [Pseudomonadota bacterium]